MMAFMGLMLLLVAGSMVGQELLPPLVVESDTGTWQVYFLLPWVTFYALSLAVPYPLMLFFALVAGFLWDARMPVEVDPEEFRLGTGVAFFALFGTLTQGVRPLFRKGNWILPTVMVGAAVFLHLMAEFALLCLVRGSFAYSGDIWFKMVSTTVVAMGMAPFLLSLISGTAKKCGYALRPEQFRSWRYTHGYPV